MRKLSFFAMIFFAGFLIQSCASNDDGPSTEIDLTKRAVISFNITGIDPGSVSRAAGNNGPIIDRSTLATLVNDMRILVFNPAGICVTYADVVPSMIVKDNVIQMLCPVGILDFVILTNVNDPVDNEIMPKGSLVGSTQAEILAMLKDNKDYADPNFYRQAPELFYYHAVGIPVIANPNFTIKQNVVDNVVMKRIVSKIETTVNKTEVYADALTGTSHPAYITSIDTIILRNVSPDINMAHGLDNRAPDKGAAVSRIADHVWDITTPATPVNKLLSFATDGMGVKPFVIIGAEVEPTDPFYVANVPETLGPNGKPMRYWGLQLESNFLRENVRLLLTITKLIGAGKLVHPTPLPTGDVQFVISFVDWDPVPDIETGNGV